MPQATSKAVTQGPLPRILELARAEIGTHEVSGPRSNPRIDEYLSTVGLSGDETPWCAAFINWLLMMLGLAGTGAANARSFLKWGVPVPVDQAKPGDIVVLRRGSSEWQGHVMVFEAYGTRADGTRILMGVGGNQSNAVTSAWFSADDVLGIRRVKEVAYSTTVAAATGAIVTKASEQSVDFVTTLSTEAGKAQDLVPMMPNNTLKVILATVSALLMFYVIFERIRRLKESGQ